jgi:hypothetical protein
MNEWKQGTVFLRHVGKDGKGYIQEHACWHVDKFMASQQKQALDAGGHIEVVTEDDYRREHWANRVTA